MNDPNTNRKPKRFMGFVASTAYNAIVSEAAPLITTSATGHGSDVACDVVCDVASAGEVRT